jgi:hypothetical protein
VRALCIALALALAFPAVGQEKAPKKKAAPKAVAHKKASPEQIRKFNELQKKRQPETK